MVAIKFASMDEKYSLYALNTYSQNIDRCNLIIKHYEETSQFYYLKADRSENNPITRRLFSGFCIVWTAMMTPIIFDSELLSLSFPCNYKYGTTILVLNCPPFYDEISARDTWVWEYRPFNALHRRAFKFVEEKVSTLGILTIYMAFLFLRGSQEKIVRTLL